MSWIYKAPIIIALRPSIWRIDAHSHIKCVYTYMHVHMYIYVCTYVLQEGHPVLIIGTLGLQVRTKCLELLVELTGIFRSGLLEAEISAMQPEVASIQTMGYIILYYSMENSIVQYSIA